MRMITKNSLLAFRWVASVDIGALAVTLVASAALAACSAAVPDAEKALSAASKKADGIYGISPVTLQLRASSKANFASLAVFASVSGSQVPLATNFNTGYITGLTEFSSYLLKVHGVSAGGQQTPLPIAEYATRTWDVFDRSSWSMDLQSSSTTDGSIYRVSWAYQPWALLPAGDGAREGAEMSCYFVQDAGVGTDPFVSGAKRFRAMLHEGQFLVSSGALGLAGDIRAGCEVTFTDGYVSRHSLKIVKRFTPAIKPCEAKTVKMYDGSVDPFSCTLGSIGGLSSGNPILTNPDYSLALESSSGSSNFCSFIEAGPNGSLVTKAAGPNDESFGTCRLDYRLSGPSGFLSPVLTTLITVENVKPGWQNFPVATSVIRESSPNDPALAGAFDGAGEPIPAVILTRPGYFVSITDGQIQTDKETLAGTTKSFGKYQLQTGAGVTNSCFTRGTIFHFVGSTPAPGINADTGAFVFMPYKHFFGSCTVDIAFDDKHGVTNPPTSRSLSDTKSLTVKVDGYNDKPSFNPGAVRLNPSGKYSCEGDACYVGIDHQMVIGATVGGSNNAKGITEVGQTLYLDKGNCITDHPEILSINFCQLVGNDLTLSFAPIKKPTTEVVKIRLKISDTGNPSMPSATYPSLAELPGFKPAGHCLAGVDCRLDTPATNLESEILEFEVVIKEFNLPIRPALIVSKGACIICHATVVGDVITDFGNSPAGSRFENIFFRTDTADTTGHNGWISNRASYRDGWLSINKIDPGPSSTSGLGTIYTKQSKITAAQNPAFIQKVSFTKPDGTKMRGLEDSDASNGNFYNEANLLDFLRSPTFKLTNSGVPSWDGTWPGTFIRSTGDGIQQANMGVNPIDVRDTLPNNSPIEYLQISAPLVKDIQFIGTFQAAEGSTAKSISWSGTAAGVGALYRQPTAGSSVPPRPFSGLSVTTRQPIETVRGIRKNNVPEYVTSQRGTPIECYGDIVVKGNLYLSNPEFHTDKRGCRIHVTGDVLFHSYLAPPVAGRRPAADGMIVKNVTAGAAADDHFGVQITSASSILFGIGQNNGRDNPSRYTPASANAFITNSLLAPTGYECYRNDSGAVMDPPAGGCPSGYTSFNASITDTETNPASPDYVLEYPASLDGWNFGPVNYNGLMVNAPVISGRYLGKIKGSVIADYAIARLGALVFEFDDRFLKQVPFPLLQTIPLDPLTGQVPRKVFDAGPCTDPTRWECNNGPK